ncbi:MAG: hypothetical protein KBS52_03665 [Clostridiales bacterium]|nr:hypothetical protein [Candidatus Equinaster intestinalis]
MEQSVKCKSTLCALELWAVVNGEQNGGSDNLRDLITFKGGLYTGYFVMVDKSEKALEEFIEDAYKNFNREYVVFGGETDYLKYREQIPQNIGLICNADLYGFGYATKIMRKAKCKNS